MAKSTYMTINNTTGDITLNLREVKLILRVLEGALKKNEKSPHGHVKSISTTIYLKHTRVNSTSWQRILSIIRSTQFQQSQAGTSFALVTKQRKEKQLNGIFQLVSHA